MRVWCLDTEQHLLTIDYSDFVWRVFLVIGSEGKPLVVAFVSAEDRIVVSNAETGETVNDFKGRLVFAGLIPLFDRPVVLTASGEEDLEFIDVETGLQVHKIEGGFCKVFRAVVSYDEMCPIMVYTTWNAQNRRSTIQTYDLSGLVPKKVASSVSSDKTCSAATSIIRSTESTVHGKSEYTSGGLNTDMCLPSNSEILGENEESVLALSVASSSAAAALAAPSSSSSSSSSSSTSFPSSSSSSPSSSATVPTTAVAAEKTNCTSTSELCEGTTMHIMFEGDSKDGVTCLAVSRAKLPVIVSGHYDFNVRVWDLLSRKLLYTLEDHNDWVVSVALWKGAESMAVSGSSDGTIKLWDLKDGKLLTTCEGHLRDVWSVTVTEGKKPLIVSASVDRTMRSWDINQFLLDTKWTRRKAFCMFLTGSGFLDPFLRHSSNTNSSSGGASGGGVAGSSSSGFADGGSSGVDGSGTEEVDAVSSSSLQHEGHDRSVPSSSSTVARVDTTIDHPDDDHHHHLGNDCADTSSLIVGLEHIHLSDQSSIPSFNPLISVDDAAIAIPEEIVTDAIENLPLFVRSVFQSVYLCSEIASYL